MNVSANISSCGKFRYHLTREWDLFEPTPLLFVMLNPSTADDFQDDPTIRKCIGFAQRHGFGGIEVVNLFAYRATRPADLAAAGWPEGPRNRASILQAARRVRNAGGRVVAAWGANARKRYDVADEVLAMLRKERIRVWALRLLDDGTPGHPLMLPYTCQMIEIRQ